MKDAQALFRDGVMAVRERKDVAEGRRLLVESLRRNPQNDMAWVWLARTTSQPEKRLECIERALAINPANEHALALKAKLMAQAAEPAALLTGQDNHDGARKRHKTLNQQLTPQEAKQIAFLLKKADHYIDAGDPEAAIEQWVEVLHIQVDHEDAMRSAVGYLARLKYLDDARELVWRAIEAGTPHPSIYLTAIDIARRQGNPGEADDLRERLARLPDVDDQMIATIAQQFVADHQAVRALDLLNEVLEQRQDSQVVLTALGDLYRELDNEREAMRYYDRAARLGAGTKVGREADKKLAEFVPVLTNQERGSIALAWREAAGFGLVFLFMGWQDAGLDLLRLGPARWAGVALGIIGGYLLVTATSSPQQQPIARWLGGYVPDKPKPAKTRSDGVIEEPTALPIIPPAVRTGLGAVGLVLIALAVWLVFNTAIQLLVNPAAPADIPTLYDLL
jgi:tetratricopeptide (TPR) repeat protein